MKTTKWIWLIVLLGVLGCNIPEPSTIYNPGDIVYHKLGGGECVLLYMSDSSDSQRGNEWKVRYIDIMGKYHYSYFYEAELSSKFTIPKVSPQE